MHSRLRKNEIRKHNVFYSIGTLFKFQTALGAAYGVVSSVDEGGWIYPAWHFVPKGCCNLPGWFRSTQVQKLETFPPFEASTDAAY